MSGLRQACVYLPHAGEAVITIWRQHAFDSGYAQQRKLAWRMCREFQAAQALEEEFGISSTWNWKISLQAGSLQQRAIRLLLREVGRGDGQQCETVVLFPGGNSMESSRARLPRATACISSQPGCGVGCPFCATGELGYRGNLTTEQIVEQVYLAGVVARRLECRLRNVVFMGMGEPLHNSEAVLESVALLTSDKYFGLSPRRITVSTAGVPGQMVRFAREFPRVRIALSLHSADPTLRRTLVPRATGDIELLRETIREINDLQPSTPVWLEIVLLAGVNDDFASAASVVEFCHGLRVEVNLIPYNAAAGADQFLPTPKADRERFAAMLRAAGIRTTLRTSFGSDYKAACGQLGSVE